MPTEIDLTGLKKAIAKAGSQSALARKADCGQQTISDIIKGRRPLTVAMALKVARATGMRPGAIHPDLASRRAGAA